MVTKIKRWPKKALYTACAVGLWTFGWVGQAIFPELRGEFKQWGEWILMAWAGLLTGHTVRDIKLSKGDK